ncbi:riboflavin biosynthesis protein RibF [Ruminococcus sp. Marseille-P6503]|uniref:riboflavin biosynthesis protein RibF n=1 Tax=Ruminococcus sp. Marseille-P6503 TaxID=2364796 RepID=UPI001FA95ADB|nr:riboflavin biosynthesis protein RibF [Ruminococcus sp. Marseille-P6503]
MICITDNGVCGQETVCALGLFDGVHRGHRLIIEGAAAEARRRGIKSAVFTFQTDSVTSKGHDGRIEMLLTDEEKRRHFERLGADYLFSPVFGDYRQMTPEAFVRDVLKGKLHCVCAVCGTDYTFGSGAAGKAEDLIRLGKTYGIEVKVTEQLRYNGGVISSTEIRRLIRQGDIARANEMLGYRYGYTLPVEHGSELGRTWSFPTINQKIPKGLVLPKFGVYCSRVLIDGKWYNGVANIGVKPSVNVETEPLAETFIIGYEGDLYGRELELRLYEFVRPERKFASFEELKAEIGRNTEFTKKYFSDNGYERTD